MNAKQSKMARAGLGWSATDLADKSGLGYATVARFETGDTINAASIAAIQQAFAKAGVQFSGLSGRIGASVPE